MTLQEKMIQALASLEAKLPRSVVYFSHKTGMKVLPRDQAPTSDLVFIGYAPDLMFLYQAKNALKTKDIDAKAYAYEAAARHVSNVLGI